MSKRRFSDAFPTFSSALGVASTVYNAFKRSRTSYTVNGSDANPQKKMAFRKRRRLGSRTTTRRRRRFRGGLRRKLTRFSRTLRRKGILAIETKYYEGFSATPSDLFEWGDTDPLLSNARIAHLTAIPGGTTRAQRVGNKIWIRKIRLHLFAQAHPTAGLNEQYIRIYLIRDLAPIVPDVSSVASTRIGYYLQATSDSGNLNLFPWQYINSYRSPRPQILYSTMIKVSRETGAEHQYKAWKKTINIFKPCHWDDSSANANVGKGQIYLFAYTNEPNAAAPPKLEFAWRTMYTDA